MVKINRGITIIPELAISDLSEPEKDCIRFFKPPAPVREISLVTYRHFVKQRLIEALKETILRNLPQEMNNLKSKTVTEIY